MNTIHALDQALATLDSIRAHGGRVFGTTKDGRRNPPRTKRGVSIPCACGCGAMSKPGTKYALPSCQKRVYYAAKKLKPPTEAPLVDVALPRSGPQPASCAVCPVAALVAGSGARCDHPRRPMSTQFSGVPGRVLRARGLCPWGRT